jgi:hypothetical protein
MNVMTQVYVVRDNVSTILVVLLVCAKMVILDPSVRWVILVIQWPSLENPVTSYSKMQEKYFHPIPLTHVVSYFEMPVKLPHTMPLPNNYIHYCIAIYRNRARETTLEATYSCIWMNSVPLAQHSVSNSTNQTNKQKNMWGIILLMYVILCHISGHKWMSIITVSEWCHMSESGRFL